MIKYLGSKRTLVPVLGTLAAAGGGRTAADLFTGTTRVAQEFKRRGMFVTTIDTATYSDVLSRCFIATDSLAVDAAELADTLAELNALPGVPGYFTRTFCEDSRYFQPKNGARIDAIRDHLRTRYAQHPLLPVLLTSLMLAADAVDSTTGVQQAYLKQWAPRSHKDLVLRAPQLLPGAGSSVLGDALEAVELIDPVDVAYVDPPYNQHRYYTNYHIWETLIRWDSPAHYGVACKRVDSRDVRTKSAFNSRRTMPDAFERLLRRIRAELVIVSYNNEAWLSAEQISAVLHDVGHPEVAMLPFDSRRYIGSRIGIHDRQGRRVGEVSHVRNVEYVFVAGNRDRVEAAVAAVREARPQSLVGQA